jgi:pimeloyl-ACP methyl ester carboxylesterase
MTARRAARETAYALRVDTQSSILQGPDSGIRFFDVDGARLRVCVEGSGPPLMMLNGIGANLEVWEPLKRHLTGRRLISYDAPGTGASPAPDRRVRMPYLADLVAGILDRVGYDVADVLGYSHGGALAQQFTHQYPERVRRLILAGTIPGLGGIQNPRIAMQAFAPGMQTNTSTELRQAKVARVVGGRSGSDPAVLEVYERNRMLHPPSARGYRLQLYAISGWSSVPWLHTIEAPTLVLAGGVDPLVPPINSRIFTRLIPNCRRYIVAGGGHLFLIDQPEESAYVIDAFLSDPDPIRRRGK